MGPVSAQRRGRARPLADRHRVPAGRAPPTRNRRGAREGQPRHPPLRIVASRQGGSRSRGVVLCTQDRGSLRGCLGKVWASSDKTLRETLARCVTYYAAHRRRRSSSGGASASSTSPRATTPSISPAQAPMAASGSLGRRHSGRAATRARKQALGSSGDRPGTAEPAERHVCLFSLPARPRTLLATTTWTSPATPHHAVDSGRNAARSSFSLLIEEPSSSLKLTGSGSFSSSKWTYVSRVKLGEW